MGSIAGGAAWVMEIMTTLEIQDEERPDGEYVIRLKGPLDFSQAADARATINRRIEEGARRVVVDLNGVEYIDSAGLGVLVGMLARSREHGSELAVVCSVPRLRRVFDVTKLSQILPLYDTPADAGV
jgi:anti-sigma B factor antagonist